MDPKSKLANTILQKSVIKTILENNFDKGEMDVFLTKTILANPDKEVTVQEFLMSLTNMDFIGQIQRHVELKIIHERC